MAKLSVSQKRLLAIAKRTLQMSDIAATIMGGMTKAKASKIIRKLTGVQRKSSL